MKTQIKYSIECLESDFNIEGNFLASGDPVKDRDAEQRIHAQLNEGNQWAWCTVKVTAYIPGTSLSASDYLGCCSYESQRDFERDVYFADMKLQAKTFLLQELDAIRAVELVEEV